MSHVAQIELEIQDLGLLKSVCSELGLIFMENQTTYRWYGSTPAKCDHAIQVPGATYELGVENRGTRHVLLWDSFEAGGLEQALGKNAGRLKQAYAVARVRQQAHLGKYRLRQQQTANGTIQLTLSR